MNNFKIDDIEGYDDMMIRIDYDKIKASMISKIDEYLSRGIDSVCQSMDQPIIKPEPTRKISIDEYRRRHQLKMINQPIYESLMKTNSAPQFIDNHQSIKIKDSSMKPTSPTFRIEDSLLKTINEYNRRKSVSQSNKDSLLKASSLEAVIKQNKTNVTQLSSKTPTEQRNEKNKLKCKKYRCQQRMKKLKPVKLKPLSTIERSKRYRERKKKKIFFLIKN